VTDDAVRSEGLLEDRILRIVAGEEGDAGQRQAADPHHRIGDRDLGPDAAHPADVLLVRHRMDDAAGTKEEQGLEEGMGEEVEDATW
jgi:hypothetical protein